MLPVFIDGANKVIEILDQAAKDGNSIDAQNLFMVSSLLSFPLSFIYLSLCQQQQQQQQSASRLILLAQLGSDTILDLFVSQ